MIDLSVFSEYNYLPFLLVIISLFLTLVGWKIEDKLLGIVAFFFGVFICSSILFGFSFLDNSTYRLVSFFIIILVGFLFYELAVKKDVVGTSIFGITLGLLISFIFINKGFIGSKPILEILNSLFLGEKPLLQLRVINRFRNLLVYLPSIFLGVLFVYKQDISKKILVSFLAALGFSVGINLSSLKSSFIWGSGIILSDLFFIMLLLVFLIQVAIDKVVTEEGHLIRFEEIKRNDKKDTKNRGKSHEETTSPEGDEMSDFGNFADENEFNF